jgi:hypothetical protein
MGIVAIGAISFLDCRMNNSLGHAYFFFFMALKAKFITLSFEKQFWDLTVSEMAILALFFLDHCVYVFQPKIFVYKISMTLYTSLAHKLAHFSTRGRRTGS